MVDSSSELAGIIKELARNQSVGTSSPRRWKMEAIECGAASQKLVAVETMFSLVFMSDKGFVLSHFHHDH